MLLIGKKFQIAKLDDSTQQQMLFIVDQFGDTPESQQLVMELETEYQKNLAKIAADKAKMGNADLLMNFPILLSS